MDPGPDGPSGAYAQTPGTARALAQVCFPSNFGFLASLGRRLIRWKRVASLIRDGASGGANHWPVVHVNVA